MLLKLNTEEKEAIGFLKRVDWEGLRRYLDTCKSDSPLLESMRNFLKTMGDEDA